MSFVQKSVRGNATGPFFFHPVDLLLTHDVPEPARLRPGGHLRGDEHDVHLLAVGDGRRHRRGRRGRRSCGTGWGGRGGSLGGTSGSRSRRGGARWRSRWSWCCCCWCFLPRCWRRHGSGRGASAGRRRRRRRPLRKALFRHRRGDGDGLRSPHEVAQVAAAAPSGCLVEGVHELTLKALALLDLLVRFCVSRRGQREEREVRKGKQKKRGGRGFFVLRGQANSFSRGQKNSIPKVVFQIPHLREKLLVELEDVRLVSGAPGGGRRGGPDEENARLLIPSPRADE